MKKRGPKPKKIINTQWSANLAYAIGLIATDGYLSTDGLLVDLTSKDRQQLENYSKCFGVKFKIGSKIGSNKNKVLRVQFKNRLFYNFLLSVGLTNRKSLTIGKLAIPKKYFFDFLRGCFDGDGYSYSYWDPRWRSSFMFYLGFVSASKNFIEWIRKSLKERLGVNGHIISKKNKNICYQLKYSKREAVVIIRKMYYNNSVVCLSRKYEKILKILNINKQQQTKYLRR